MPTMTKKELEYWGAYREEAEKDLRSLRIDFEELAESCKEDHDNYYQEIPFGYYVDELERMLKDAKEYSTKYQLEER